MGFLDEAQGFVSTGGLSQVSKNSGGINNLLTFGASGKAADANQAAIDAYGNIELPDVEKMRLELEQLVQQGVMTPEAAKAVLVEKSAMNQISLDPRMQKAQMDALTSLQDISANKGLTDMDRAQLAQIGQQEDTAARGQREAILQNMQARGAGGSGMELLSQMKNQQDAATRKSSRDTEVAGMAQQRALQALQQAGQLGGQMQGQDFARQAQIAQANDAINQFNAQNQQQVGMANVGARNQAQALNLAEKQRVADTNTQLRNQQQQYNKNLSQQNFQNQATLAGGKAGAFQNQAQAYTQEGASNKQLLGSGLQAGAAMSDERAKTDVSEFDASQFLDSLVPSKYRYKDPGQDGHGKFAGVMAQDLEKTEEGDALVHDTPRGKMVDSSKGFGTLLAALGDVHQRLKKVEGV